MTALQRYALTLAAGVLLGAGTVLWWQRPAPVTVVPGQPIVVQRPDLRPQDVARLLPAATQPVQAHRQAGGKVVAAAQATGTIPASQQPQTVEAVAVVSQREGKYFSTIDLFSRDLHGAVTPISATVTSLTATPDKPRWRLSAALTAGLGWQGGGDRTGAVVGLRWLTRGRSRAAEDGTWALLTPAALITAERVSPAILPVSLNAGRVVPVVSDVWVSPLLVWQGGAVRGGVTVTATF